jgi:hypothetical protein
MPVRTLPTCFLAVLPVGAAFAQVTGAELDSAMRAIEPKVIEARRDLHAHPELSNRETRTADIVAKRLRALGAARRLA